MNSVRLDIENLDQASAAVLSASFWRVPATWWENPLSAIGVVVSSVASPIPQLVLAFCVVASGFGTPPAYAAPASTGSEDCSDIKRSADIPAGACALNLQKKVVSISVEGKHIAANGSEKNYFYPGIWFSNNTEISKTAYESEGTLKLNMRDMVATVNRDMSPGLFPTLSGASNFYIEVESRISDSDRDHWPAIWMLPIEHNNTQPRSYPSDPVKYERYMELDIDEGNFGPGITGTAISWQGKWPDFKRIQNPNNVSKEALDRTQWHRFGVSYNARDLEVTWWLDDKMQHKATTPYVPEVARMHNYFLILSAQQHGKKVPYTMEVRRIVVYQ